MTTYRVLVPANLELINSNERLHHMVRARRTRALREWAHWQVKAQKIPKLKAITVDVVVHPGRRTRRLDPPNWSPTSKACIDGLVDAGVLPDDTGDFVKHVLFRVGERWDVARPGVELLITPAGP
jgi:hypothetical protein